MIVAQQLVSADPQALADVMRAWHSRWKGMGVLAFVPEAEVQHVALLQQVANALQIVLLGGVFPALVTERGFASQGICLLCLEQAPQAVLLDQLQEQGAKRLAAALQALQTAPGHGQSTLFTIFDAMVPNIGSLMEAVHMALPGERRYLGVSAGSETFQPMPCLFDNQRLVGNAVLALVLPDAPQAVVRHGYAVSESIFSATSSAGNRITQIDERPAFAVYQELIRSEYGVELTPENFYQMAVHFPFGLVTAVDVLVRIPVGLGEDGSLYCVGEIPQRSMLRLLSAPRWEESHCVSAIQAEMASLPAANAMNGLMVFYCAGRRLHFAEQALDELNQLQRETACPRVFGALSLGEIDSLEEFLFPRFHNAAMVCWPQQLAPAD